MSLQLAVNIAKQALVASQKEMVISGRNIAAANDPDRSRIDAPATTTVDGGVRLTSYRRAEDAALFNRMVQATSRTAEQDAMLTHLTVLADTVGDPQNAQSPAALIGDLQNALVNYANAPDDPLFGAETVERARDLADALNNGANELLLMRERADAEMARAVEEVNRLLDDFDVANGNVKRATINGDDATVWLDRRDAIVSEMSQYLGVSMLRREDGDMALFTDGGVTLFDRTARRVEFDRTPVFTPTTTGAVVRVDGLALTGPDAVMPLRSGSIVGEARIRDEVAITYKTQLDEMARVLEETFDDPAGGLFVSSGAPDTAGTIAINPALDPLAGGDVNILRDGSGNPSGFAAYADRLLALGAAIESPVVFDPAAELSAQATLQSFAAQSVSWLEGQRSSVDGEARTERAILLATSDALSNATGVNLDDEYANQLAIERSFAASSRLITLIDEMFAELLRLL